MARRVLGHYSHVMIVRLVVGYDIGLSGGFRHTLRDVERGI